MVRIEPLMKQNFLEYASYVIIDRAIPDIRDGLKPVQRRILHTLFQMQDGKLNKVANVVGETMKLHPHGEVSISDALVNLANKGYFIDRQGNFGNPLTGHRAAASRYIECRLTPLALETLFNEALTEFSESYDGRTREPVFLPAKLPVALMLGADGIAVGMATPVEEITTGKWQRWQDEIFAHGETSTTAEESEYYYQLLDAMLRKMDEINLEHPNNDPPIDDESSPPDEGQGT